MPILQGLCLTSSRADWAANDDGLSPLDVATQVAVPEFDGRLITVPFSFKEFDADGLSVYVPDPERAARVAGIAVRHARLRHIPNADKRIVLMLIGVPDQARPDRQRGRSGHAGQRRRACSRRWRDGRLRRGRASRASPSRTATR